MSQNIDYSALLSCFLPGDYFQVTHYVFTNTVFRIWWEEKKGSAGRIERSKCSFECFFKEHETSLYEGPMAYATCKWKLAACKTYFAPC